MHTMSMCGGVCVWSPLTYTQTAVGVGGVDSYSEVTVGQWLWGNGLDQNCIEGLEEVRLEGGRSLQDIRETGVTMTTTETQDGWNG